MASNHSDESDVRNNEMHDKIIHEQNEEHPNRSTVTFEYPMDDATSTISCSNSDDDEDDENSLNITHDDDADNVKLSEPDTKEISTVLALFRHRHNLSKSCINDLCDLLRSFGIPNVPTDFRTIERNMMFNKENVLQSKRYIVCAECGNKGTSSSKCENVKCKSSTRFTSTPTTLCTFKILPQLTSILDRHSIMNEPNSDHSKISDVQEGQVRRNVVYQERLFNPTKKIINLLLNSDGVVLKKFSRSIWVCCMIINELPRKIRFNNNNIIICSISMGGTKPKKNQFQGFIADWVHELRQLELGFHISPPNSNDNFIKVHAYLIAASLDKPAQALLLNINESTGFYSCGRCTIQGKYY
jgi:hypothetical protein